MLDHFAAVEHILHAGDIGWPSLLLDLEGVAPVTAVQGNTDFHPGWRDTEVVTVGGLTFLVHHIVEPRRLRPDLARRIALVRPDVVVFGHTHATFCEVIDGVMYLNPGSAGSPRHGRPRTVATLEWTPGETALSVDFLELGP